MTLKEALGKTIGTRDKKTLVHVASMAHSGDLLSFPAIFYVLSVGVRMMTVSWQQSITLYQLRIFLTVTRHHNYTHAAEELYLSQPSVSAQVHELERLIGLPLFEQVGRRLVLTQAGHMLEEQARKVLSAVEQAADSLNRLRKVEAGHLRLAASTTVGAYLLPKVLGTFHARYPQVELALDLRNSLIPSALSPLRNWQHV